MAQQDLDPRAVADLARSGLSSTDMMVENVPAPFGAESAGYLIPYFTPTGERHPKMYRMKLYQPKPDGGKYKQPEREELDNDPTPPYFAPPTTYDYSKPAARKLIVEGEKKAVAALKYLGIASIGIGGCWNWAGLHTDDMKEAHRAHPVHPQTMRWIAQGTKRLEIVLDGDMFKNENVGTAGSGLWWALREKGIDAVFVVLPHDMGLDDWILAQPDGTALEAFERLPRITGENLPASLPEMFKSLGISTSYRTGYPETNERTVRRLMTRHPRYKDRFWVDVVKHRTMDAAEAISDAHRIGVLVELQEFFPKLSAGIASNVMNRLAWERPRNLITEWLDEIAPTYDGQSRLAHFGSRYLGIEDTPFTQRAFLNFLVAAIARMKRPGTKFDHMLVLQGAQGIGKTRALLTLFGKDYASIAPHTTAIGSRDWLDAGGSGWCLILDELAGLSKVEHTELKTAISTESDTYRRAYRADPETFHRMFVLAATTNDDVYLTDPTGARRYWNVECGEKIDVERLEADRAQLWAEAMALYAKGFDFWHLPEDAQNEAKRRQEDAYLPDPIQEACSALAARARASREVCRPPVVGWMGEPHYFIGTRELMIAAAGDEYAFAKNAGLAKRIRSAMLKEPGWRRAKAFSTDGGQRWGYVYYKPHADAEDRVEPELTWEEMFGRNGSKF